MPASVWGIHLSWQGCVLNSERRHEAAKGTFRRDFFIEVYQCGSQVGSARGGAFIPSDRNPGIA